MGSKEVMITAPLMVVLYDRAFRLSAWKEVAGDRRRVVFYCLLAATGLWPLVATAQNARAGTAGFDTGLPWHRYLYSQAWAILHYLRLALWPNQLTFDYGQRPIVGLRGVPGVLLIGALLVATLVAWIRLGRWTWLAFLGAWFFLLLAPSSSVVPVATEIAAERRVYLAFAAVTTLAVVLVLSVAYQRSRFQRPIVIGWCAALALLTATTFARSRTYADPEALWRDTVRKAPTNPRAFNNLASTLFFADPPRLDEAKELYYQAIALDSTYLPPWTGLASVAVNQGRLEEAKWLLEQALAIDPEYADAVDQMGRLYLRMGQPARAIPYLERFAKAFPSDNSLTLLATAYLRTGRLDAAVLTFRDALELDPNRLEALRSLGGVLVEQGRGAEAVPQLERATSLDDRDAVTLALLSVAYAQTKRADDAIRAANAATTRAPNEASVLLLAGRAMLVLGRTREAEQLLSKAVALDPTYGPARDALSRQTTLPRR
jgi:tetratricopeptide (TPR) repeat protein